MEKTVINGGYLIDPANKVSSKLNLAIENGKIVEISHKTLMGDIEINAEGLIVSPGFIDCHMHEDHFNEEENKFQVNIFEYMLRMGVTTAIGGNCGGGPLNIPNYIEAVKKIGIPINLGLLLPHGTLRKLEGINDKYGNASPQEIDKMKTRAKDLIDLGLLGVSFGIRYIPGINRDELMAISSVCQKDNKAIAAHIRDDANNVIESAEEFISIAKDLSIPVQLSHIGSMAAYGQMDEFLSLVDYYNSSGIDISMDCYPYNAFSTSIGTTTYDDGFLERYNTDYTSIEIAEGKYKGQRCTEEIFKELRQSAPGTLTLGHLMKGDEVNKAMAHPNVLVASDGVIHKSQGHPRAAGTFPRVISQYVKKEKVINLYQAIEKMTSLPAKRFDINKGSLGIGSDADITIFDFDAIKDNASFKQPTLAPDGIDYVLINGQVAMEKNDIKDYSLGKYVSNYK